MEKYYMNIGRNAGYRYIFSRRDTGEVLLEGTVTGGNKTDCRKAANLAAMDAGLHPATDDNLKLYMKAIQTGTYPVGEE